MPESLEEFDIGRLQKVVDGWIMQVQFLPSLHNNVQRTVPVRHEQADLVGKCVVVRLVPLLDCGVKIVAQTICPDEVSVQAEEGLWSLYHLSLNTINMSVSVKARRLSLNTFNVLVVCFLTILLEIPQVAASPQNVQEAT